MVDSTLDRSELAVLVPGSFWMLDHILRRGLRQLKRTQSNILQEYRKSKLVKLDRAEIRKKVQSLHDYNESEEWGVGSKFNMDAFELSPKLSHSTPFSPPTDVQVETIISFIQNSSASEDENLKLYHFSPNDPSRVTNILLSLSSSSSRRARLQTILTGFKPLFPKRDIPVDGDTGSKSDWIVIDLKSAIVHIFDPQTRAVVDLDSKLKKEAELSEDADDFDFESKFSKSIPRNIASRPNFIDKYLKLKLNK